MEKQPQYCECCFRDTNKEEHQEWCKYYRKINDYDLPEGFEDLFNFKK